VNYTYEEINGLEKQLELSMRKLDKLKHTYILIKGTDASKEFKMENEIAELENDIQEIKKTLSSKFNFHNQEGSTILEEKIRQLNIEDELGILHLVNCNRKTMIGKFWEEFDEKENEHFQFYFISACNTQMPHSFSERMIYEIIIEELEEEEEAIHVHRHTESSRIKIYDLPSGRKIERSQKEFIKFFGKYFKFKETEDFDTFLKTGIPNMEYEYVAIVFEVVETEWKDYYQEYFQWIIEKFTATHDAVPKFLFFFVTYLEGLHDNPQSKAPITNVFSQIAENNLTATHLSPLQPVKLIDVKDWIRKIGERNPVKIQEVIDTLTKGLNPEKRKLLQDKQLLNMADMERLQELVYKIANEENKK
jgi:hypothetical protein